MGQRIALAALLVCLTAAAHATLPPYTFTRLAGTPGGIGYRDGIGSAARLYEPTGIAADGAGNIYFTDYGNHVVRRIDARREVTTFAGTPRVMAFGDGRRDVARFHCPYGVAVDAAGDVFVGDSDNAVIRRVGADHIVTTIAGAPEVEGAADGIGDAARFREPYGVALAADGSVIVADSENNTIRRVMQSGAVTTIAGNAGIAGASDGPGTLATFDDPTAVAVAPDGSIYVADSGNAIIRRIDVRGVVTTVAGTAGLRANLDGIGAAARFHEPTGIAVDRGGIVYVSDLSTSTIRRITPDGLVTTIAGTPYATGSADGFGAAARFRGPTSLAVAPDGTIYIADTFNDTVRALSPSGEVTTIAGAAPGNEFNAPDGVAMDRAGNVYVADSGNDAIRRIAPDGTVTTLVHDTLRQPAQLSVGDDGTLYAADYGNGAVRAIDASGAMRTITGFQFPTSVAAGPGGVVYVADRNAHAVRAIDPSGDVRTIATGFTLPYGVAADAAGNVFVADFGASAILRIAPGGEVTTIAANIDRPTSVAIAPDGSLLVTLPNESQLIDVTLDGIVTSVAGGILKRGTAAGSGEFAESDDPIAVSAGPHGEILLADRHANIVQIGRPAIPDRAELDGRTLRVANVTATSFHWTIIRRPAGSRAELSGANSPAPLFVPDMADTWTFELTASSAAGTSVTQVTLRVPPFARRRAATLPAPPASPSARFAPR